MIAHRTNERGSALIYIFIAIGLLAALTYAVTGSGTGGTNVLSDEKSKALATQIITYSNTVANAIAKLRINGVAETSLCFDSGSWPAGLDYDHAGCTSDSNKIFDPDGGNVTWKEPPAEAMTNPGAIDNQWLYNSDYQVPNIGTTDTGAGDETYQELTMFLTGLKEAVCLKINQHLGITAASTTLPTMDNSPQNEYVGVFNDSPFYIEMSEFDGKKSGCYHDDDSDIYVFYRVLLAR